MPRTPIALLVATVTALLLVGCASTGPADSPGGVTIVAATNVWADIAAQVVGPDATVTALIDDPSQDPHEYQASGRDELAVSRADIVIVNGGGYDDFLSQMIDALGTGPTVVNVFDIAESAGLVTDDNEHLWFNFDAVTLVIKTLGESLAAVEPGIYDAPALVADLDGLRRSVADLRAGHAGTPILVTEPLPHYLVDAAGLVDVTPPAFSEALEDGLDVSPSDLAEVLDLVRGHSAALLVYNTESTSGQAEQVLAAAQDAALPIVEITELLPAGLAYQQWMAGIIGQLGAALGGTSGVGTPGIAESGAGASRSGVPSDGAQP